MKKRAGQSASGAVKIRQVANGTSLTWWEFEFRSILGVEPTLRAVAENGVPDPSRHFEPTICCDAQRSLRWYSVGPRAWGG
jgi:hypothetical protein